MAAFRRRSALLGRPPAPGRVWSREFHAAAVEGLAQQDLELGVDRAKVLRRDPLDRRVKRGIEAEGEGLLLGWHDRSTEG